MSEIAKLFVSIGADTKEFAKGIDGVKKSMKDVGDKIGSAGSTMTKFATGPILAAGAGLIALATKAGNTADRLLDLADITGMSTRVIQEYQHVAKIAGVSTEAVTGAVEGLVKRLPAIAKEGGPAYEALNELGFAADDLQNMDPDMMINKLITSLADMDDPLKRNAIGAQVFGGAWKDMAPILGMGAEKIHDLRDEAHELGIVLGEDALNQANEFRKEMEKLKGQFGAVFMELGTKLAPVLRDVLLPIIQDKIIPAIGKLVGWVEKALNWFTSLDGGTQNMILGFIAFVAALGPVLIIVGKVIAIVASLLNPIGLVAAAVIGLGVIWKVWGDDIKRIVGNVVDSVMGFFGNLRTGILNTWDGIVAGIKAAVNNIIDIINRALSAITAPVNAVTGLLNKIPGVNIPTISAPKIPSFDRGGTVPGRGPQLVMAHGGETILPTHKGAAGVSVNFHGDVYGALDFEQKVKSTVRDAAAGGAFRGVLSSG